MASDGAGNELRGEGGAGVRAEVGALPDIGRREAGGWLVPAAAALAIAALPLVLSPYGQDVVVRIAIYAIFALSLELLVGATGLVSLGHAAFLGIGAYVTVLASGDSGASLALLASLLVGMIDTFGTVLLPQAAGVLVYVLMALILLWKPNGLFRAA